jgi:hypothetical protein
LNQGTAAAFSPLYLGSSARNLPERERKNFLKFLDIPKGKGNGPGESWGIGKQFEAKRGRRDGDLYPREFPG